VKERIGWGERLRYAFDKSMAAGTVALIGWLAVASLAVIIVAGLVLSVGGISPADGEPIAFGEGAWASLMRTLDPGTMGGDEGWAFRLVMLAVTIAGIFIISALIGILTSGLEERLLQLRKGRSRVLEEGHTVILNWSDSIFDIVAQLGMANESRRRARIVILARRDKVEMEEAIAVKVPDGRAKVICRSGDPTDLYDLAIVRPETSKSIVILAPEESDPDSQVVKTILALVNDPSRPSRRYRIAAEVRDMRNAEIARVVGGDEVQLILADELIARIVVHSSRQVGLSAVYSELLDFAGCEIYTVEQPALTGKTFGEAVMAYDRCSLIGLCDDAGKVKLNPPSDLPIAAGMRAIIIAEDESSIGCGSGGAGFIDVAAIREPVKPHYAAERTLVLGWNRRGRKIATELARYVQPGSSLTIAGDGASQAPDVAALKIDPIRLKVDFVPCDTTDRDALQALNIPGFDHIIVLGCSDDLPPQAADTRTLVTLLHLRKIAEDAGSRVSVVSEMIDVRNRELAEVTRADDFVVSNKLVSLMLAQASENEHLAAIFADLLDETGSEIYMRPVTDLVAIDRPLNFHTIAEAARRRGEIAFGTFRRRDGTGDIRKQGGVVVNPERTARLGYQEHDRIIVLSEG
jgi:voltage-gated potassium channel Kch